MPEASENKPGNEEALTSKDPGKQTEQPSNLKETEQGTEEKPPENTVPPEMEALTQGALSASIKGMEPAVETPEPKKIREPFVCPEEDDPWWDAFRDRITAALYPSDTTEGNGQYSSSGDKEYDFLLDIYKIILHPDSAMPENDFVNLIKTTIREVDFQKYIRYFAEVDGKKDDPDAESLNKLLDFLEEAEKEEPEPEEETADAEKESEKAKPGEEADEVAPDQLFLVDDSLDEPEKDGQAGNKTATEKPEKDLSQSGTEEPAAPKVSPAPQNPKADPSPTASGPKWKNEQNQNSDNGNTSIIRKKVVPTEDPDDLSLTEEGTGEEGEEEDSNE